MGHLEDRVRWLATWQGGIVSRSQAVGIGVTRRMIERLARTTWGRVHPAVYAVGHDALTARGRAIGALLACGMAAVLSHRTAGALWGVRPDSLIRPEVILPGAGRNRKTVEVHRGVVAPRDVRELEGLPVTSLPLTILGLAEVCPLLDAAQALREARVLHRLRPEVMRELLDRSTGRHGVKVVRGLLDGPAGEPTRSWVERRLLTLLREAGLPLPAINARIGRFEVDFVWHGHRLIIETDGWAAHGDRRAFEADRARDAELGVLGWTVYRFTFLQIRDDPFRVVATIAQLLAARAA